MKSKRIVQITDTHVVESYAESVLSWDPIIALKSVVSGIKALSPAPELVIATGDLVHEPSSANYSALKSILSTLKLPVLVIPGNHDSVHDMNAFLVGGDIQLVEYKEFEESGWAIVFVDSQVQGEEHGNVSQESIVKLEEMYRALSSNNILLALHHSPTPECLTPSCQLKGRDRLFEFLSNDEKTKAVVSGHTHCQTESEYSGVKLLTTPSTLFQVAHSQSQEPQPIGSFMDFHKFDASKRGYRTIDLYEDGDLKTEICWV